MFELRGGRGRGARLSLILRRPWERTNNHFFAGGWSSRGVIVICAVWLCSQSALTAETPLEERLELSIQEGVPAGTLVGSIRRRPGYDYRLNERSDVFAFDPLTGAIKTATALDRERLGSDTLELVVVGRSPAYFISVRIRVRDLNDNPPRFPFASQNVSLPESARVGTRLLLATAADADAGDNGRVAHYRLSAAAAPHASPPFSLVHSADDDVLQLQLTAPLDREAAALHVLNVSAVDAGRQPLASHLTVFVHVLDANDNAPLFDEQHYVVQVAESLSRDAVLLQLNATDADEGRNADISYSIGNDRDDQFSVDSRSGVVRSRVDALDCPQRPCANADNCSRACVFTVEAVDGGLPAQRGRAFVNVEIIDENDHDPEISFRLYPQGADFLSVDESKAVGSVVAVVTVSDEDAGVNARTHLTVDGGNELGHFRLDSNDLFGLLRVAAPLDRHLVAAYNLSFVATDGGSPARSSRRFLPVFVKGADDRPPSFVRGVVEAVVAADIPPGGFVAVAEARDEDSGGPILYSLSADADARYFAISESGLVTRRDDGELLLPARLLAFGVNARNSGPSLDSATATVRVRVDAPAARWPTFTQRRYVFEVAEDTPTGFVVGSLPTTSPLLHTRLLFDAEHDINVPFGLDGSDLVTSAPLDFESADVYRLTVRLCDLATDDQLDVAIVQIRVLDVDDNTPTFQQSPLHVNMLAESSASSPVARVLATDRDSISQLKYFIESQPADTFLVDEQSGEVTLKSDLPISHGSIDFVIGVIDTAPNSVRTSNNLTVHLHVLTDALQVPRFLKPAYNFEVDEHNGDFDARDLVIGSVSATDFDGTSPVRFEIVSGNDDGALEIGRYSGQLRGAQLLDRDRQPTRALHVVGVGSRGSARVPVRVVLRDANDNAPVFRSAAAAAGRAELTVRRDAPLGHPLFFATATDVDAALNGRVRHSLTTSAPHLFAVDPLDGRVFLRRPGYALLNDSYVLLVTAADGGTPPLSSQLLLRLSVLPSRLVLPDERVHLSVSESAPVNSFLRRINVSQSANTSNGRLLYRVAADQPRLPIGVFPDGWLFVKDRLDAEQLLHFELRVIVDLDTTTERLRLATVVVTVDVLDENDNTPQCLETPFRLSVRENAPLLTSVGRVVASDLDSGLNGFVTFALLSGQEIFLLDDFSGELRTKKRFDREQLNKQMNKSVLRLQISATDSGSPQLAAECTVEVEVLDENDNAPEFSLDVYSASIVESSAAGTEVMQLTASDRDDGENAYIFYTISSGNDDDAFELNANTGILVSKRPLDRETRQAYRLVVQAADNTSAPLRSSAVALISVTDVNDQVPRLINFPKRAINLSEWTPVGSLVTQLAAVDDDEGAAGRVRFFIASGNVDGSFEMAAGSGRLVLVKPLDFERVPAYTLTVTAADGGAPSLSSSVALVVNVVDENDNAPQLYTAVARVPETAARGAAVLTLMATDVDSALNGELRFGIVEQTPAAAFRVDERTGQLFVETPLDRETVETYKLRVVAHDLAPNVSERLTTERSLTIIVADANDNAPELVGAHAAAVDAHSGTAGSEVARLLGTDRDIGLNGSVAFDILEDEQGLFGLTPDGVLFMNRRPLAARSIYRLLIEASDRASVVGRLRRQTAPLSRLVTTITFNVITEADSASSSIRFEQAEYDFEIAEDGDVGALVGRVSASGAARVEYFVTSVTNGGARSEPAELSVDVDAQTGELKVARRLDCDYHSDLLLLRIHAVDVAADSPNSAQCTVRVKIWDANDEAPVAAPAELDLVVSEAVEVGRVVGVVRATDADASDRLSFALSRADGHFAVDARSGEVRVSARLDRERAADHRLVVNVGDERHTTRVPVRITVADVNDNAPRFVFDAGQSAFVFGVAEGAPRNSFVGRVLAVDADRGNNGTVSYRFLNGDFDSLFAIDPSSGAIHVSGRLDHEQTPLFVLDVQAVDGGEQPRSTTANVYVVVNDINDNKPEFSQESYSVRVLEDIEIGSQILQLEVADADSESDLMFEIVSGDPWQQFSIAKSGVLSVAGRLDRETRSSHQLTVAVHDAPAEPRHTTTAHVLVSVADVNDNAPVFVSPNEALVSSTAAVGSLVGTLLAEDADDGVNGRVEYRLEAPTDGSVTVDAVTGQLRLRKPLVGAHPRPLVVVAVDRGTPSLSSRAHYDLRLLDWSAARRPRFDTADVSVEVAEDAAVGTLLTRLRAEAASPPFYWLQSPSVHFVVQPTTGVLLLTRPLDYEAAVEHRLTVAASPTLGDTTQAALVQVVIRVTDVNDNIPLFPQHQVELPVVENFSGDLPAPIGIVTAVDADSGLGGKVQYAIIQGNTTLFRLDSTTGEISINFPLDRELRDRYDIRIEATDSGLPRLSSRVDVAVPVLDTNDNAPLFDQPYYQSELLENQPADSLVTTLRATDPDMGNNGVVSYSLVGADDAPFKMGRLSGQLRTTAPLDRERRRSWRLTAQAADAGAGLPRRTNVSIVVSVLDQNDNAPRFYYSHSHALIPDTAAVGDIVLVADAVDADAGQNGNVTLSLSGADAAFFAIDPLSGGISFASARARKSDYELEVLATDGGSERRSTSRRLRLTTRSAADFPVFATDVAAFPLRVAESAVDTELIMLQARSPKQTPFDRISYAIVGGDAASQFQIDAKSGRLATTWRLDRQVADRVHLYVAASDSDQPSLSTVLAVPVLVGDVNDNAPVFSQPVYTAEVAENERPPVAVVRVGASDADDGANGRVAYRLLPESNVGNAFAVDERSGLLTTRTALDRETVALYELWVEATDEGQPARAGRTLVRVRVGDRNDNAPRFTRIFRADVREDAPLGAFVTQVSSADADTREHANNTYYLTAGAADKFAMDPFSGNVTVAGALDRETAAEYQLTVAAVDGSWRVETALAITVTDVNDNAPTFDQAAYIFRHNGPLPFGAEIGSVSATDLDAPAPNSDVHFSFATPSAQLHIDPKTGLITVAAERLSSTQQLVVVAANTGLPKMRSSVGVSVLLTAENLHAPEFSTDTFTGCVPLGAAAGTSVLRVAAFDKDGDVVKFSMIGEHPFDVNLTSGQIVVAGQLESEGTVYVMRVQADDSGAPRKSAVAMVRVEVVGENRNAPRFLQQQYRETVEENAAVGTTVVVVQASDADEGFNGQILFTLAPPSAHFRIDERSGTITTASQLDYERQTAHNLTVVAIDSGCPPRNSTAAVSVAVIDLDDNRPSFASPAYDAVVSENAPVGTVFFQMRADDADERPNNAVTYEIADGNSFGLFAIDRHSGNVSVQSAQLDYEASVRHTLTVIARAAATDEAASSALLYIGVASVNEFAPVFARGRLDWQVDESVAVGTVIGAVNASDADDGADGVVFYFLDVGSRGRGVDIDRLSGELFVASRLRHDAYPSLTLVVWARNRRSTRLRHFDSCEIFLRIMPTTAAPIYLQPLYTAEVLENATAGTPVLQLPSLTADLNYKLRYKNVSDAAGFLIDRRTGLLEVAAELDREAKEHYEMTVAVYSVRSERLVADTALSVRLLDVNDKAPFAPPSSHVGWVAEGAPVGTGVLTVVPVDADLHDDGAFRFRLTDASRSFSIHPQTGVLSSAAVFDREQQAFYDVHVEITDSGQPPQSAVSTVRVQVADINDNPSIGADLRLLIVGLDQPKANSFLAVVRPADVDSVGDWACEYVDGAETFLLAPNCSLYLRSAVGHSSTHRLLIRGFDGVHDWVNYTVNVDFSLASERETANAVALSITDHFLAGGRSYALFMPIFEEAIELRGKQSKIVGILRDDDGTTRILVALEEVGGDVIDGVAALALVRQLQADVEAKSGVVVAAVFDPCSASPCANGGACRMLTEAVASAAPTSVRSGERLTTAPALRRSFACSCGESFAGRLCETAVDRCAPSPCANGGSCVPSGDAALCVCARGFNGERCETDVDECSTAPCENGGYCENTHGGFRCICLVGFAGAHCHLTVDHCSSQPCQNGGTCAKQGQGYSCHCLEGFYGAFCDVKSYGFGELSYVELAPLNPYQNYLSLQFSTRERDALLLYSYNSVDDSSDYVAVDIVNGRIRLSASLAGQGQMNLMLEVLVNDARWYQLQIDHKFQTVTLTVNLCDDGQTRCQVCQLGNSSCSVTAYTGLAQILVPGASVLLGGVRAFAPLLSRPGQLAAFSFFGCIRDFEMNGKSLAQLVKSQNAVVDGCAPADPCALGAAAACGATASRCLSRLGRRVCRCGDDFETLAGCDAAEAPVAFDGGFVAYRLSEHFRRRLLFHPVEYSSLVNSDDLMRVRRSVETPQSLPIVPAVAEQHFIELDFKTNSRHGLLFFASSLAEFSLIDLSNGTLRFISRSNGVQAQIGLSKMVSDGKWHRATLATAQNGHIVKFGVDEMTKHAQSAVPVHIFLDSKLSLMSVGGLNSAKSDNLVQIYGVLVPEFIGCLKRFVLDGKAQPLGDGVSSYLEARRVGEVRAGCTGAACPSPPCTGVPIGDALPPVAYVLLLVLLGVVVLVAVVAFVVWRRGGTLKRSTTPTRPSTKLANLAFVSPVEMTSRAFLAASTASVKDADVSGSASNLYWYQNPLVNSTISLAPSYTPSRATVPSVGAFPLAAANPIAAPIAERYDLDNASSIAPSDVDVSHHYRDFREGHRSTPKSAASNPQIARVRRDDLRSPVSAGSRSSPASVKQLKAALRASPAANSGSSGSSDGEGAAPTHGHRSDSARGSRKRRTPVADSSGRSSLKRPPRAKSSASTVLSVKDLQRYHSNPTFEHDSSSSSNEATTIGQNASGVGRAHPLLTTPRQILSRSPHAPPVGDSSTEASEAESVARSELHLDAVRRPRRLVGAPVDTETESECGTAASAVPRSLAPFRPPRSMFPVSEDESDAPPPSAFRPAGGQRATGRHDLLSGRSRVAPSWYHQQEEDSTDEALNESRDTADNMDAFV